MYSLLRYACVLLQFVLVASLSSLCADVVQLKSGETLQGKVLRESETELVLEYQRSAGIRDEKVLLRSDIAKVSRQRADDIDFAEIKKELNPFPVYESPSDYQRLVEEQLKPFLAKHPQSAHSSSVQKLIAEAEAEREHLLAGDRKVAGQWVNAESYQRDQRQIEVVELFRSAKQLGKDAKLIEGIRKIEYLDTNHHGVSGHADAISLLKTDLLPRYSRLLAQRIKEQPLIQGKREHLLAALKGTEKKRVEEAIARETQKFLNKKEKAEGEGSNWRGYSRYNLSSMREEAARVEAELTRLQGLDFEKMKKVEALVETAREALLGEDSEKADAAIKEAEEMGVASAYLASQKESLGLYMEEQEESLKKVEEERLAAQQQKEADEKEKQAGGVLSTGQVQAMLQDRIQPDNNQKAQQSASIKAPASSAARAKGASLPSPPPVKEGMPLFQKIMIGFALSMITLTVAAKLLQKKKED